MKVGDRLGPYEILSSIGAGGMGVVWRARDTRLNRTVAIKVSKEQFSERFEREAHAVAALNHPHVCTLYDVGPNYLVMEYIEGEPVRGPLPAPEAVRLALEIADALDAIHASGINHRDLKPGNILRTRTGIKVLDFGIAKRHEGEAAATAAATAMPTEAGVVLGTAAYMSPEQAQGKATDRRSDIFAFGLVLYEMLSGRRAFSGGTTLATMAAILHTEPAPLDAPTEIARIVARCLRKSASERFQTMADVRRALEQVAAKPDTAQPSIAVLPFANMSGDKDNEYFSDGLAEEILNALTKLPGLRVIARASAFAFRGRERAVKEIGETLRVGHVLHGSVRRAGNRIRVNAQLIDVSDESQLWSEHYDRELRDVFDIQDEIAHAIVEKLKVQLGRKAGQPLVKRYTENLEAHSLYLKGNFHLYRLRPEEMEKARQYLEQAVALEPGHAPALVQLADYHIARSFWGQSPREAWPKALEAARRAVAADEDLAEAHAVLGWAQALSEYQWAEALSRFETALRLNPASARTHFWRGIVLHCLGREEEASLAAHQAVELDPLSTLFRSVVAFLYLCTNQYERAAEQSRQMLDVDPNFEMAMGSLGQAYSLMGRHEEGIELLEKAQRLHAAGIYSAGWLGWAYVRAGRRSDAERFLIELEEGRRRHYFSAGTMVIAALSLGDVERAIPWLDKAVEERDPNLLYVIRVPEIQPLRVYPRFQDILRKMNLPQ